MRYCKGAFVISPERDIPLLLYVRNSNFISHDQLFEFVHQDCVEWSRSAYNWRVQRLLRRHYLEPVTTMRWQGCAVYTVTRDALTELESFGHCAVAFNSATRRRRDQATVYHALELNAIRLAFGAKGVLHEWKTEMQVGSFNMVAKNPYQKDYDALVTLLVGDQWYDFALEYERTLKSVKRYEKILEALENEYQVDCILYLTADPVLLRTLVPRMRPVTKSIAFTTARAVREQSLAAPLLAYPGPDYHITLEQFLRLGAYKGPHAYLGS
jgi:hypothetical protein